MPSLSLSHCRAHTFSQSHWLYPSPTYFSLSLAWSCKVWRQSEQQAAVSKTTFFEWIPSHSLSREHSLTVWPNGEIIFQHLAVYIKWKHAHWRAKFAKVGPKFPQIVNKHSKNYPRLWRFCQNGEISPNLVTLSHLLCEGNDHCMADLLFDWFGFDQTCKSQSNSTQAKQLNPNQSNRRSAIQWNFPLQSKWVFSGYLIILEEI